MQEKDMNRLKKFYKLVLPVFKIISKKMQQDYYEAFPVLLKRVKIDEQTTVLDVGTGTGGLAGLFLDYTPHVTGIDFSPEMIAEAKKRYGDKIKFLQKAAHELKQFRNDQFDLVTAAYSLHDMDYSYRLQVLNEMKRVARKNVIIFDFVKNRNLIILAVESLEGSYYLDFIKNIDSQLAKVFPRHEKIKIKNRMGLYICEV